MTTFVTAFFDLGKFENNIERRQKSSYMNEGRWLLNHPHIHQIIIFAEPDIALELESCVDPSRHRIILKSIHELPRHRDLGRISACRRENPVRDESGIKDTPTYIMLMWSKYDLLLEAMELNRDSKYFAWIDFGIHYIFGIYGVTDAESSEAFEIKEDRVKVLVANHIPENADLRVRLGATGGGYVTGERKNLGEFARLFLRKARDILDQGFAPSDEEIIPKIIREHTDLVAPYYGHTRSIFTNYVYLRRDTDFVLNCPLARAYNAKDWKFASGVGDFVWKSYLAGACCITVAQLRSFLDTYFIVAYWSGEHERAREIKIEYTKLRSLDDFEKLHGQHAARVTTNFAFV